MTKRLTDKHKEIIESMYCVGGVSMKNIALYFVEMGKPIDESVISKHLKKNNLSRGKGGALNSQPLVYETIYAKALRLAGFTGVMV